ncbi:hypothetical protein ACRAWD_29095 [Caulobacter segnis]
MTAIACLRGPVRRRKSAKSQPGDIPRHRRSEMVRTRSPKARWRAPRKCGAASRRWPFLVVADHNVESSFDPAEVQGLAAELEKVLFPGRTDRAAGRPRPGDLRQGHQHGAVLKSAPAFCRRRHCRRSCQQLRRGAAAAEPGRVHVITADSIQPAARHRLAREAKVQGQGEGRREEVAAWRPPRRSGRKLRPPPVAPARSRPQSSGSATSRRLPTWTAPPVVKPEPGKAKPRPTLAAKLAAEAAETAAAAAGEDRLVGHLRSCRRSSLRRLPGFIGMRADLVEPPPEDDSKQLKRRPGSP